MSVAVLSDEGEARNINGYLSVGVKMRKTWNDSANEMIVLSFFTSSLTHCALFLQHCNVIFLISLQAVISETWLERFKKLSLNDESRFK